MLQEAHGNLADLCFLPPTHLVVGLCSSEDREHAYIGGSAIWALRRQARCGVECSLPAVGASWHSRFTVGVRRCAEDTFFKSMWISALAGCASSVCMWIRRERWQSCGGLFLRFGRVFWRRLQSCVSHESQYSGGGAAGNQSHGARFRRRTAQRRTWRRFLSHIGAQRASATMVLKRPPHCGAGGWSR